MTPQAENVLVLLRDIGPMTAAEIAKQVGRGISSSRSYVRELRQLRVVFITAYERQPDGMAGRCIPVYAVGDLPDVAEPRKTPLQRSRDYIKRHRARLWARDTIRNERTPNFWAGLMK